ncbi:MAG: hypothetical protein F4Y13_06825 [Acidimicrobiaceae bacterium]|nr:hypothetical protein [Acidimicrobiaceae bacterium]
MHYHHAIALVVAVSGWFLSRQAEDWPIAFAAFLGTAAVIWGSRSIENAAVRVTDAIRITVDSVNEGLALIRGDRPLAVPGTPAVEVPSRVETTDSDGLMTEDDTETALLALMHSELAVSAMSGLHALVSAVFDRQTRVTPERAAEIAGRILDSNEELMEQLGAIADEAPRDYWDDFMAASRQGETAYSGAAGRWRGTDRDRPLTPEPETPTALAWRLFRQQEQTVNMLKAVSEGDLASLDLPQNHLGLEGIKRRETADGARDRVDHAACEYLLRLGQVLGVGLEPRTAIRRA